MLAELTNSRDMFAKAMDLAQQALKIDPQSANGYRQLGIAYAGLGRLPEALESINHALSIAPEDGEAKKLGEDLAKKISK